MNFRNNSYISFVPAQRDKHTYSHLYLFLQQLWNRIGKLPVERQREYNVSKQGLEVIGNRQLPAVHLTIKFLSVLAY